MSGPITVSVNANGEISLTWPALSGFEQGSTSEILRTLTPGDVGLGPEDLCEQCAEILGIPESLSRLLCARLSDEGL